MSAFICSDKHISAIVKWVSQHNVSCWFGNPSRELSTGNEQELVDILYAENVRSVNYRYGGNDATTGGVYDPDAPLLGPVEVIKAIQSLEYQSCEHDEWNTSNAKTILLIVKDAAISKLPGYESAAWSI